MAEKKAPAKATPTPEPKLPIEETYAKQVWDAYKDLDKNNNGALEFSELEGNLPYRKVTRDGKTTFDSSGSELLNFIFRAREAALANGKANAVPVNEPVNYKLLLMAAETIISSKKDIAESREDFRKLMAPVIMNDKKIPKSDRAATLDYTMKMYDAGIKLVDPNDNGISFAERRLLNGGKDEIQLVDPKTLPAPAKSPAK